MITTFGKLIIEKGETDNPKDLNVSVIGFNFEDETLPGRDKVLEILDYLREQLQ